MTEDLTTVLRQGDVAMWSAGLDWVRLTLNSEMYGQLAGAPEQYRTAAIRTARQAGYNLPGEPWSMRGYGGEKWGGSGWGENYHQGLMLDVSGYMSDWATGLSIPYTNVSRLDLQVTYWLTVDVPDLARRLADASEQARRKVAHRPWKIRLAETVGGGSTLYLGERKDSPIFIRCYDKMREATDRNKDGSEWRNAWRFEIELKEGEGSELYAEVALAKDPMKYVSTYVDYYLRRRGILLPYINGGATRIATPKIDESDKTERRLIWLSRYVAPTIDKMRSDGVSLDRIVSALEIGD